MAQELTSNSAGLTPLQRFSLQHSARLALDYMRGSKLHASQSMLADTKFCAVACLRRANITAPREFNTLTPENARKFRAWCLSQLNSSSTESSTQQ